MRARYTFVLELAKILWNGACRKPAPVNQHAKVSGLTQGRPLHKGGPFKSVPFRKYLMLLRSGSDKAVIKRVAG